TVALGLAGGYLLGRFRKGRWLLMAAAMAATRRRGGLLRRGAESLKSSPEIGKLAEEGKEAAAAVLGRRIEGLTGMISTATRKLRGEPEEGAEEEPEGGEPEAREEREGEEPEAREGREGEERRPEEPEARQEREGGEGPPRGAGAGREQRPQAGRPQRAPRPGSRRPGVESLGPRRDRRADPTGRRTGPSRVGR